MWHGQDSCADQHVFASPTSVSTQMFTEVHTDTIRAMHCSLTSVALRIHCILRRLRAHFTMPIRRDGEKYAKQLASL